jgi:hypothetical protein
MKTKKAKTIFLQFILIAVNILIINNNIFSSLHINHIEFIDY